MQNWIPSFRNGTFSFRRFLASSEPNKNYAKPIDLFKWKCHRTKQHLTFAVVLCGIRRLTLAFFLILNEIPFSKWIHSCEWFNHRWNVGYKYLFCLIKKGATKITFLHGNHKKNFFSTETKIHNSFSICKFLFKHLRKKHSSQSQAFSFYIKEN